MPKAQVFEVLTTWPNESVLDVQKLGLSCNTFNVVILVCDCYQCQRDLHRKWLRLRPKTWLDTTSQMFPFSHSAHQCIADMCTCVSQIQNDSLSHSLSLWRGQDFKVQLRSSDHDLVWQLAKSLRSEAKSCPSVPCSPTHDQTQQSARRKLQSGHRLYVAQDILESPNIPATICHSGYQNIE